MTELSELENLRDEWQAKHDQTAAQVATLEAGTFKALVEGNANHRELLAEAKETLKEADLVLQGIAEQLPAARAQDSLNRAGELRAEAAKLISQAEEIEGQVEPLLVEIERLQGCKYIIPPSQSRFGGDLPAKSQQLRVRAGKLEDQALNFEISASEILEKAQNGKVSVPQWTV